MREIFEVGGMVCASCQATVQKAVEKLTGVERASVSLIEKNMVVEYDPKKTGEEAIEKAVRDSGYFAQPASGESYRILQERRKAELAKRRAEVSFSLLFVVLLMIFAMGPMIAMENGSVFLTDDPLILIPVQLVLLSPILALNSSYFTSGFKALFKRHPNMNSLIALGASAAILYGLYALVTLLVMRFAPALWNEDLSHALSSNLYFESAGTILGLASLGKYLEDASLNSTMGAFYKLMALAPDKAVVVRDGKEEEVLTRDLAVGDVIRIKAGDRIPVDGTVCQGEGSLDQSSLTGESKPVEKHRGDEVMSGTINLSRSFLYTASKVGKDTALSQIVDMVSKASTSKAKIAKKVDAISYRFVPVVLLLSLLCFVVWISLPPHDPNRALNFSISVLVISCPCALGLATPVAMMVGTGKAAQKGILVKSAESYESLSEVDVFAFDKTGTLTQGRMALASEQIPLEDQLAWLSLENLSNHPISKAVVKAHPQIRDFLPVEGFQTVSGLGLSGTVAGHRYESISVRGKKEAIPAGKKVAIEECLRRAQTVVTLWKDGSYDGFYSVSDALKPSAQATVKALEKKGKRVVLLTGDSATVAEVVAQELGIEQVEAECLPQDKYEAVKALQKQGHRVAMVGDGINDAPSLVASDCGIAVAKGNDIAMESASVVLVKEDLTGVLDARDLSVKIVSNMKANLFWAFAYNALAIPLAAGVFAFPPLNLALNPMIASLCMALSSLSVVLNALRLKRWKRKGD